MVKVITYGTYDVLHYGHIRLLERAKALGDYLIVGVTSDDYDKTRGKINLQQSLMERVKAVRETGIADEIIIEEYEGQKIDDIKRYGVDIFAIGSDWQGKFDYLEEYCKVVYLERTQGISSTELRTQKRTCRLGLVGDSGFLNKVASEAGFVNGLQVTGVCASSLKCLSDDVRDLQIVTDHFEVLLDDVDAVYIRSVPELHYLQIKTALEAGKHVLCESPITLNRAECEELFQLAESKNLVLMEAIKTAYATAYSRLLLMLKGGKIGEIISVDATCTSLRDVHGENDWRGIFEWGPTALLPVFQILGTDYKDAQFVAKYWDNEGKRDRFAKLDFIYDNAVACVKVGDGVKSEGELIVSGTEGYLYVPSPWWKTDYYEVRYENPADNRRYFYQLDGEGIRYELVAFARSIEHELNMASIEHEVSYQIAETIERFVHGNETIRIG